MVLVWTLPRPYSNLVWLTVSCAQNFFVPLSSSCLPETRGRSARRCTAVSMKRLKSATNRVPNLSFIVLYLWRIGAL